MFSENYRKKIIDQFQKRMERLGAFGKQIEQNISEHEEDIKDALYVLYGRMPVSDMADYPVEVFEDFARWGVRLWEKGSFANEIPEDIFASYVLFHRVNDEEIEPCRSFFGKELEELMKTGITMAEAALAVNYWCAGEVSYHQEDDRTASAMSVYRCGEGRCGEESTFVVNVLRSAGIPARQVYAPHWSHCDDNHAWVEVWCDGTWHYLGACEPEETLDQGWFDGASSRAMMIHTPYFGRRDELELQKEPLAGTDGCAALLNELSRYAKTTRLQIEVTGEDGKAQKGARVSCCVVNYASFLETANGTTDEAGRCEIETGLGTLLVSVSQGDYYGEQLVHVREGASCRIKVGRDAWKLGQWEEMECFSPVCRVLGEKVKQDEEKLAAAAGHLQKKKDSFWEKQKSRLSGEKTWNRLVNVLPEKDLREVSEELLERQVSWAERFEKAYPQSVFESCLLNPRIGLERLTCYGEDLTAFFSEDELEQFRAHPDVADTYVETHVKTLCGEAYKELLNTPISCLTSGYGSGGAKEILKAAILRTVGIPTRLSPIDGRAQRYWNGKGQTVDSPLPEGDEEFCWLTDKNTGILCLKGPEGWNYRTDYSVSMLRDGQFYVCQNVPLGREVRVPEGIYRICTANRLPNGNVFAKVRYERVEADGRIEVELEKKEAALTEMLSEVQLPEISLKMMDGEAFSAAEHAGIYIWAEPGKEPTEHIFNELTELAEGFSETPVYVVAEGKYFGQKTYEKLRKTLPTVRCLTDDDAGQAGRLARCMFREPGLYPLILVVRQNLTGIYGEAGYNVGTADMLLRIIKAGLL